MLPALGGPPGPSPRLAWMGPLGFGGAAAWPVPAVSVTTFVLPLLFTAIPRATAPRPIAMNTPRVFKAVPICVHVKWAIHPSSGARRSSSGSGIAALFRLEHDGDC